MVIFVRIVGITAEYNPFHRGHQYHIAQTKELIGENCAIVCVMSGNFVQRGSAAVYRKHARARAAIECGADLVLELPVVYALSSAEGFAMGAVSLLDSLGCVDELSFGSECGDIRELSETAQLMLDGRIDPLIRENMKKGVSYAAAVQAAAETLAGRKLALLRQRNDILGVEYIKALKRLGSAIRPVAVRRETAYQAASEIRGFADMLPALPEKAAEIFKNEPRSDMRRLDAAVLAALRMMTPEQLGTMPGGGEGLSDRIRRCAAQCETLDALCQTAASKRCPQAHVRRTVLRAFLGIDEAMSGEKPPYARVLAMNGRGTEMLNRASGNIRIITKPAAGRDEALMRLEAKTTDVYALTLPEGFRTGGSEWTTSPYFSK